MATENKDLVPGMIPRPTTEDRVLNIFDVLAMIEVHEERDMQKRINAEEKIFKTTYIDLKGKVRPLSDRT